MCVERIGDEERAELDLSSWDVAFTGAEPVRLSTLERFQKAFAPCGFKREAWFPCYGLAEATLMVSGGPKSRPPRVLRVATDELQVNRVVPDPEGQPVVSCGEPSQDQQLVVVDPETRLECRPAQIGEFWLASSSVASGYWHRPKESEETFSARLAAATPPTAGEASRDSAFLRTGDLGFVWDGELYVTGRCKDLIIIAGRNHYPQDIERTIEDADEAILTRGCGVFCLERADSEVLVAIAEVRRSARTRLIQAEAGRALLRAVRRAVAREHDLHIADLVLVIPASLPRTSSGKLRRGACRLQYQRGSLRTIRSALESKS
jgi:acyl-CoA synthetase (AMP-forming)/AMP-acid ligase II